MVGFYQLDRTSPSNLGCYGNGYRHPGNLGRLRGLGDSVLCPGPVKSQLDDLAAKLAQAQSDITATGQQITAAVRAGQNMADAGQLLSQQQADLNSMISALTYGYRTFCGTVPPFLSGVYTGGPNRSFRGMGVIPAIPIGTAAVLIAGLVAAIAAWWIYEQQLKDKVNQKIADAQGQQQNNIAYAQQQLANAFQSGDTAAQAAWQKVLDDAAAASPGLNPPSDIGKWLSDNWPWVAGGAAAFLLLPRLL